MPDLLQRERAKKVRLGINRTQIRPRVHDIETTSVA